MFCKKSNNCKKFLHIQIKQFQQRIIRYWLSVHPSTWNLLFRMLPFFIPWFKCLLFSVGYLPLKNQKIPRKKGKPNCARDEATRLTYKSNLLPLLMDKIVLVDFAQVHIWYWCNKIDKSISFTYSISFGAFIWGDHGRAEWR